MSLGTILLVVLVLLLLGVIPAWPHSRSWGYGPSGGLGIVLIDHHRRAVGHGTHIRESGGVAHDVRSHASIVACWSWLLFGFLCDSVV